MWAPDAAFALLFLALVGNHRSDSMPLRHIGQFHSESWLLYAASSMMWGRTLPGSEAAPSACGSSLHWEGTSPRLWFLACRGEQG